QWAYLSTHPSKRLTSFCYDDNDDYDSAITHILSTEEPIDSLSMGDEHLDTISTTKSDEVIKSSVEDLVPIPSESEGIPDTMCDVHLDNNHTPLEAKDQVEIVINSNDDISSSNDNSLHEENIEYVEASPHDSELVSLEAAEIVIPEVEEIEDDNLREKLLNVHLLIANIEALKDNPTPSSELLTKSSSTSLNSFLEQTNTFHNSLSEFENFYFDLGEISSGSTTTHSDISLSDYEAFYFDDDHIKEISSGSTITHSDISLSEYASFIFDLTHEEFVDELAHIISPLEYDCFYFRDLPDQDELMSVLNSRIRENLLSTTSVNLPIEDDHSPLLAYVWLNVPVRRIRTDNGTEFVNQTLRDCYEEVGISHETSVARSPQQNRVVKRHNCTLIEAARTIDYKIRNVTISRVYFVEGLGHNLFSVGQFCDSDLEVAFRQHTCFIRNLDGVDLLTGS
nr:putative ribonuclease H-like domain-containing protein [Tanacetum cinerariifolium]